MKKRNRLAVMILVVILLCCSSCISIQRHSAMDAKTVFQTAAEKMSELKYVDSDTKTEIGISVSGFTLNMGLDISIQEDTTSDPLQMAMNMKIDLGLFGSFEMNCYVKDGVVYLDQNDEKVKYDIEGDDEVLEMADNNSTMLKLPDEYLDLLQLEQVDGKYQLSYTIEECSMNDYFNSAFQEVSEYLDEIADSLEGMAIHDVKGVFIINKDMYIEELRTEMTFKMEAEGVQYDMPMSVSVSYHNPGKIGKIEFPDLSGYESFNE